MEAKISPRIRIYHGFLHLRVTPFGKIDFLASATAPRGGRGEASWGGNRYNGGSNGNNGGKGNNNSASNGGGKGK